jgi:hypothetical protein
MHISPRQVLCREAHFLSIDNNIKWITNVKQIYKIFWDIKYREMLEFSGLKAISLIEIRGGLWYYLV